MHCKRTIVFIVTGYCGKYAFSFKQNTHSFVSSLLSLGMKGQGSFLIPKR